MKKIVSIIMLTALLFTSITNGTTKQYRNISELHQETMNMQF